MHLYIDTRTISRENEKETLSGRGNMMYMHVCVETSFEFTCINVTDASFHDVFTYNSGNDHLIGYGKKVFF